MTTAVEVNRNDPAKEKRRFRLACGVRDDCEYNHVAMRQELIRFLSDPALELPGPPVVEESGADGFDNANIYVACSWPIRTRARSPTGSSRLPGGGGGYVSVARLRYGTTPWQEGYPASAFMLGLLEIGRTLP